MAASGFRSIRRDGSDDRGRPVFPADLYAGVDLKDPAGHRLVRFGRYFRETDPADTWWDASTKGGSVRFAAESDDAGRWTMLTFDCKACRDQGRVQTTRIAYDDVEAAVTALWEASAASDVPSHTAVVIGM